MVGIFCTNYVGVCILKLCRIITKIAAEVVPLVIEVLAVIMEVT